MIVRDAELICVDRECIFCKSQISPNLSGKITDLSGKITDLSGKITDLSGKIGNLSGKIGKKMKNHLAAKNQSFASGFEMPGT